MSTLNDDLKIRNARDLVARILNHPQGGIDALLRLAEDQETDWLECKAALHPVGGVFEPGENADDYRWHVAKAAVALANSCGGVVLLGLNDALCPVGLAPSDPRGVLARKGREAFNRDVVLAPLVSTCWKTGTSGTIKLLGSMERLIEIRNADYRGQPLAAILVAPVPDNDLLELSELREFREGREKYTYTRHLIPIRAHGAVGQVRELQGKEIRVHERARANQLNSDRYDQLWQRFLASLPDDIAPAELIDARVEQALADYHTACVQEGRSLRDLFTPLDVEEDPSSSAAAHAGEFVPEAEEWRDLFASDDPWDTNDADENDDDEEEDRDDTEPDDSAEEPPPAPPRRGQVFELLAQEPRAILLGEPGAGKSTCLLRLALTQAEEYRAGAPMVLYAPLRHYTEQGLTALLARLGRQPWPVLEALIRVGRLRLLLDAVNECPRHLQPRCCQDIKALLEAHPALPVILSTRGLSYRCQLRLPTFVVRPLDREQQQRFLTTYLRGDAARATALLQRIQNQPGGALIASNPLLLRIIVEVSRTQGELPRGRALLYRRLVEDWYQREATKEAHTGAALRWSFPGTREALATLALAARQAGRIEMERAWAIRALRPLLADDAMPFLERMAQGLLLQLDAEQDNLSFNHETVQEYLAAEALIRQPEALAEAPTDMTSSWHMPLAYAFELETDPPAALVREAWRREPLLVAAALRDTARLSALPIAEGGDPWLTGVLHTLRGETCDAESERIARDLLYPPVHPLPEALTQALASQAFWYAGLTHDAGVLRLEGLRRLITEREEPWLDLLPLVCQSHPAWQHQLNASQQVVMAFWQEGGVTKQEKRGLAKRLNMPAIALLRRERRLGDGHLAHRIKDLILQAMPMQLLMIARPNWIKDIPPGKMKDLLDSMQDPHWDWLLQSQLHFGNTIIGRQEIPLNKIQQWIDTTDPIHISHLVRAGIIHDSEIPEVRRREWLEHATLRQAHMLITCGLVRREEIPEAKRQIWINSADVGQAHMLIPSGLVRREEIPEAQRQTWINTANIEQALTLISSGLIRPEEISEAQRQTWINTANIEQALTLISSGLIRPEEISEAQRQAWINTANVVNAPMLITSGLVRRAEIPEAQRQTWINTANIEQAHMLIASGLVLREEIPEAQRQAWINTANIRQALTLISSGLIRPEEISEAQRQAWINTANIGQALTLISSGLIRPEEISEAQRQAWINTANIRQALTLISSGLIRPEEIPEAKRQAWINTANVGQAQMLITSGLVRRAEIPEAKRREWIDSASAGQACTLLGAGLLRRKEVPEAKRREWIDSASAGQARTLLGAGQLRRKEVPEAKRREWIDSASAGQACTLLGAGQLRPKEIPKAKLQKGINKKVANKAIPITHQYGSPCSPQEDIVTLNQQKHIFYTKEEIQGAARREGIMRELGNMLWDMVVVHLNPDGTSGFATHPSFDWNIYFQKPRLLLDQSTPLRKGDLLRAEIDIIFNKKREEWNFVIKQGIRTQCAPFDVPVWWQAWQFFAPRWAMAAEGRYQLQANAFNKLKAEGFDVARLEAWRPDEKEGRRIQLAQHIIARALKEPLENRPTRKQHIAQQLAGDGVWADLRQLAEAYLDGKAVFAGTQEQLTAVALDTQPVSRSVRPLFANQRRKIEGQKLLPDLKSRVPLQAAQTDLAGFLDASSEWTLYLDEAWYVPQDAAIKRNEAVMAGVLCQGAPQRKLAGLPALRTHSYEKPLQARNALESLLGCQEVLPLILHLRLSGEEPANNYYDSLLQQTIRFVLGWLLPTPKTTIQLHVFPEAIAPAHPEGDTAAEFYRGLLASDPTGRFAHWRVEAFRWKDKNFGYTPYADLLAHLTLEHTEVNRALGAWANFKHWPGYVPFSLELVPRLERLEHLETSANLSDVIDFAVETGQSPFGRLVMRDLAARLARRPDLQQRLLETLENDYRNKVRDLRRLRQAFAAVRGLLPALPEEASPRMRLLWYLLALQDANHDGDPERIRATAGDYLQERETLKQNERELCADADLNLAVHYADRFAFGHAEVTVGEWISDPLFAALSPRQQGRLYSAFGQYRAMQGDAQGADRFFLKALDRFGQATLTETERAGECEQTNIYRAINALDGGLPVAHDALEAVFGPLTPALAERFAADGTLANQYRHHLLLRAFTLRPELDELRLAYLAARDRWQTGHAQHPWPCIHGYRGFLLWNQEGSNDTLTDASIAAFDRALELATLDRHGPTVKLIGALWATVAACCYAGGGYETLARELLEPARALADAAPAIATLEDVLAAPDASRIGEAFAALPFNYR